MFLKARMDNLMLPGKQLNYRSVSVLKATRELCCDLRQVMSRGIDLI